MDQSLSKKKKDFISKTSLFDKNYQQISEIIFEVHKYDPNSR